MSTLPSPAPRVTLQAQGCRTNQYEAEALGSMFAARGWSVVSEPPWDLGVLLSCAVTAPAEAKARRALRRFSRSSPGCLRILTGCYAQNLLRRKEPFSEADLVVGNRIKSRIPTLGEALLRGEKPDFFQEASGAPGTWDFWDPLELRRLLWHTRGFIKVQDGCDHFCSYCIISHLRGRPVSRPEEEILREIRNLAEGGCGEFILTGIHLGRYGDDPGGEALGRLVRKIGALEGVERLRFGSLEPFSITHSFLTMLKETPQFCPHFHIPLQSGEDGVLRRMNRGYRVEEFARILALARSIFGEDLHVSTDLLAGFPGEDERSFEISLRTVEELEFGRLHVFPFSPREGTPAYSWPRPSREEALERCRRGIALGERLLHRYASRWLSREVEVLVEKSSSRKELFFEGHTAHFLNARFEGTAAPGEKRAGRVRRVEGGELLCEETCGKDEAP